MWLDVICNQIIPRSSFYIFTIPLIIPKFNQRLSRIYDIVFPAMHTTPINSLFFHFLKFWSYNFKATSLNKNKFIFYYYLILWISINSFAVITPLQFQKKNCWKLEGLKQIEIHKFLKYSITYINIYIFLQSIWFVYKFKYTF